jgi:mono/diheme cytochrome c family protein
LVKVMRSLRARWSGTQVAMPLLAVLCITAGLANLALGAPANRRVVPQAPRGANQQVLSMTPVAGLSYLRRLGLTMDRSSMGRIGQTDSKASASSTAPSLDVTTLADPTRRTMTLSGGDLYRLECRACHRADGTGAPPEINTLISPVQGTSLVLWQRRMKQIGRSIDPTFANEVVSGAKADLRSRVVHGGKKMPSFDYLQDAEVAALVAYLDLLAGVPGAAQHQHTVMEPATRVGEYLVKGTCHICHDATGAWPTPEALLNGAVPPLAGLPTHRTLFELVEKVRRGAPIIMGTTQMVDRGRMPVFDYITNDEAAAAFLYLAVYPPR